MEFYIHNLLNTYILILAPWTLANCKLYTAQNIYSVHGKIWVHKYLVIDPLFIFAKYIFIIFFIFYHSLLTITHLITWYIVVVVSLLLLIFLEKLLWCKLLLAFIFGICLWEWVRDKYHCYIQSSLTFAIETTKLHFFVWLKFTFGIIGT